MFAAGFRSLPAMRKLTKRGCIRRDFHDAAARGDFQRKLQPIIINRKEITPDGAETDERDA